MKYGKMLLVGAACAALAATSAQAADLTPITPTTTVTTTPMAAPSFSWGGAYAGIMGNAVYCAVCIDTWGGQVGIQAGYNAAAGAAVFGAQLRGMYAFSPVVASFVVEGDARAGFALGERALAYGLAGIGYFFGSGSTYWTAGGGFELAAGNAVSLFAEVTPYWFFGGGSPTIWRFGGGLNFHFGG